MGFKSSSGCYTNRWTSSLLPLQGGTLECSCIRVWDILKEKVESLLSQQSKLETHRINLTVMHEVIQNPARFVLIKFLENQPWSEAHSMRTSGNSLVWSLWCPPKWKKFPGLQQYLYLVQQSYSFLQSTCLLFWLPIPNPNWKITYWPAMLVNRNFFSWCNFIIIPPWLTFESLLWVISIILYHPNTDSFHWSATFGQSDNRFMVLVAMPGLKKKKKSLGLFYSRTCSHCRTNLNRLR